MMFSVFRIVMIAAITAAIMASPAQAATATYIAPSTISGPDLTALSTSGDNAGFLVGLGQTLAIVLDTPIGVTSGGSVSIFTLAPSSGRARAVIRVGSYNGGSPTIAFSRNVRAGNVRNINNLFRRGCGILSGCDYIEIVTTRTRRGAEGVEVDYIVVNGEIVEVTSPTPEPPAWAMMIIGFGAIGLRLKAHRRARRQRLLNQPTRPAFSPASNSRLWPATRVRRIVHP